MLVQAGGRGNSLRCSRLQVHPQQQVVEARVVAGGGDHSFAPAFLSNSTISVWPSYCALPQIAVARSSNLSASALMFQPVAARSHNYCLERVVIMRPDGEHELEQHFVCSLAFGVSLVAELTANLVELTRPESEN